jgi:hypothetical protein
MAMFIGLHILSKEIHHIKTHFTSRRIAAIVYWWWWGLTQAAAESIC